MHICGECEYYKAPQEKDDKGNSQMAKRGACRRYPPKVQLIGFKPSPIAGGDPFPNAISLIPQVGYSREACGEFQERFE